MDRKKKRIFSTLALMAGISSVVLGEKNYLEYNELNSSEDIMQYDETVLNLNKIGYNKENPEFQELIELKMEMENDLGFSNMLARRNSARKCAESMLFGSIPFFTASAYAFLFGNNRKEDEGDNE